MATVISLSEDEKVTKGSLEQSIEEWIGADDVFQLEFLRYVIFTTPSEKRREDILSNDAILYLEAQGTKCIELINRGMGKAFTGLCFASRGNLYEAYKLYEDDRGAFLASLLPCGAEYVLSPVATARLTPSDRTEL